jgi:prolyl-tRNA synthetase
MEKKLMRQTQMLIPTLREVPKDAEATSHQLMMRAGLIRKLMAGVYSYLPLGFKVLSNIIAIVRSEMNKTGAQELLLPAIHPAEIWKKTGRYDTMRDILMTVKKDEKQEIVLGPTHEEIITELAAGYISSYKDLPLNLYQIQSKFRDEARPRFGVIRSKEFIMKDAYSFDGSPEGLDESYQKMYRAYQNIFDRCGLSYLIVSADTGDMGGELSHEFMVKLPFGEDFIVSCSQCDLSASIEVATCRAPAADSSSEATVIGLEQLEEFPTPNTSAIDDLCRLYSLTAQEVIKTLIYVADDEPVACLVRGDHEVCESKLKNVLGASRLGLADEGTIRRVSGGPLGFSGPVNLKEKIKIVADLAIQTMKNSITGANKKDTHLKNVNYERDFSCELFADVRYVQSGEPCPQCSGGVLSLDRSLEIGHVFKLGTKYSKALGAKFLDMQGKERDVLMGCYGIGINRIMASCIELHHDERGIIWPVSIAPFKVGIITVNQKDEQCVSVAERLLDQLHECGIEALYDDRDTRAGVKFADIELIGIPFVVVIGERNLKNNQVELKSRADGNALLVACEDILARLETVCKE